MKRIILFTVTLVFLCFLIPIIFVGKFSEQKETIEVVQESENMDRTVKLLHTKTGEIEELNIETYLYGVVASEMPASYENEALKAQATVARTYTMYKIENGSKHEGADICDASSCCQAWISKEDRFLKWEEKDRENNWNKIVNAVDSTKGKIITYEGKAINAFFHSNSGGLTETATAVWGGKNYPYLQTVATVRRK